MWTTRAALASVKCSKSSPLHAGTGTVINKSGIKQYQQATRDRSKVQPCHRNLYDGCVLHTPPDHLNAA